MIQFRSSQHSATRTPRTPFDGGVASSYRQSSFYHSTMLTDESPSFPTPRQRSIDMFNPFEGDDEWSIRATLRGFNKDRSKLTIQRIPRYIIRSSFLSIFQSHAFSAILY